MAEANTAVISDSARCGLARRLGKLVAVLMVVWLAGCAVGGKVQTLADGSYKVDCSGGYHDWTACNEAARRTCRGRGVEILSQVSNEASQGVGSRDWSAAGSEVSRSMNFRCK